MVNLLARIVSQVRLQHLYSDGRDGLQAGGGHHVPWSPYHAPMRAAFIAAVLAAATVGCGLVPVSQSPPVPPGPLGPIIPAQGGGPPIELVRRDARERIDDVVVASAEAVEKSGSVHLVRVAGRSGRR